MCYKCQVCEVVVPAGLPLRRHIIYRIAPDSIVGRKEIEKEIPVCGECDTALKLGLSMKELIKRRTWVSSTGFKIKLASPKPVPVSLSGRVANS